MKAVVCLVVACVAVTLSQDAKDKDASRPTVFQRLIPADVLRGRFGFLNISVHLKRMEYNHKFLNNFFYRFSWNLLCIHEMCHIRTGCILGLETILRKVNLCGATGSYVQLVCGKLRL